MGDPIQNSVGQATTNCRLVTGSIPYCDTSGAYIYRYFMQAYWCYNYTYYGVSSYSDGYWLVAHNLTPGLTDLGWTSHPAYRLWAGYDVYQHAKVQQCIWLIGCWTASHPYIHWHLFYYGTYSIPDWSRG